MSGKLAGAAGKLEQEMGDTSSPPREPARFVETGRTSPSPVQVGQKDSCYPTTSGGPETHEENSLLETNSCLAMEEECAYLPPTKATLDLAHEPNDISRSEGTGTSVQEDEGGFSGGDSGKYKYSTESLGESDEVRYMLATEEDTRMQEDEARLMLVKDTESAAKLTDCPLVKDSEEETDVPRGDEKSEEIENVLMEEPSRSPKEPDKEVVESAEQVPGPFLKEEECSLTKDNTLVSQLTSPKEKSDEAGECSSSALDGAMEVEEEGLSRDTTPTGTEVVTDAMVEEEMRLKKGGSLESSVETENQRGEV